MKGREEDREEDRDESEEQNRGDKQAIGVVCDRNEA